jgi:hypothetical protein
MDPVVLYAALVASASLGWQIASEVRANRTRLKISVANTFAFDGPISIESQMPAIRLVNLSRHDVQMPGIDVFQPSIQRGWPITEADCVGSPAKVLPARSSCLVRVRLERFTGLERGKAVVARAVTATGETFQSHPNVVTSPEPGTPVHLD